MSLTVTLTLLGCYALLMLALAQWVERRPGLRDAVESSPLTYTLSLTVYVSAWTYYGSVGQAANSGLIFIVTYIGPLLGILTWPIILGRLHVLKQSIRITSIADYLGARYGSSHLVSGMAAAMALLGSLPYVALQLKAIMASLSVLVNPEMRMGAAMDSQLPHWIGPSMVLFIALFVLMAGVRRVDPTERHLGVIAVVALESLVKLVGFLAVGIYVCYFLFDGPGELFRRASEASLKGLLVVGREGTSYQDWVGRILLFAPVILLLPRQFHVAVVENSRPKHIRTAVWLLPLYMMLITLFVIPIALGGRLVGLSPQVGDTYVLLLPQMGNKSWLSFLVFLGGFSAAMSMIVINTMTMATMVTNDLLLPIFLVRGIGWAKRNLLALRWLVVAAYLVSGYLVQLAIGSNAMLVSMGVISMMAAAQFTPAAIFGLFWRGGTKAGAVAGLGMGFSVWLYTLVLPDLARNGIIPATFLHGPSGLVWLAPESLFGLKVLTPLNHTLFWSMLLNTGAYILVSVFSRPRTEELNLTLRFFRAAAESGGVPIAGGAPRTIPLGKRLEVLEDIFRGYLGQSESGRLAQVCVERAGCAGLENVSVMELSAVYYEAEKILSGFIGAASAHSAFMRENIYMPQEREELSSNFGRVLADMNLSPVELRERVDAYQERERLLLEHAKALTDANKALEEEVRMRARFENEARQAGERYRSIFDNAVEGIFQTTFSGCFIDANPSVARILGYGDPGELMRNCTDIGGQLYARPEDREAFLGALRKEGVVSSFETELLRRDGTPVWVALHARAISDETGRLDHIEGLVEDISERKQAEEQMRQADRAVRDIIDSMPSVMIALTADGQVVHWNQEAARRYGLSAGQAEGGLLESIFPRLSWTMELVRTALSSGEVQFRGRVSENTAEGQAYFDVMAYPLRGGAQVVLRVDDVTQRVRVEDMMVQTEKMYSIGGLAAGMAHEINNPLGAIVGAAQNIERRLEPGRLANEKTASECGIGLDGVRCYLDKRGLMEMITSIRTSGMRAADIVRNMLEFSRRSEGSLVLVDAAQILDKAIELANQDYDLKKKYDFRRINIVRQYDPALPAVRCNAMEIEQVILNLLKNAAQAMMERPEDVEQARIVLRASRDGDMARIEVEDNGPGMDEATRKRVFEPFFTTKPVGVGTGLGLSVSYFIVTSKHGGRFNVESSPGKGAKFILKLPLGEST